MENNQLTPKDKVDIAGAMVQTQAWAMLCAELDEHIKTLSNDISNAIRKKDFEQASRLDGKKEMAEMVKTIPFRIKRKNETIIERVKNLLPGNRG